MIFDEYRNVQNIAKRVHKNLGKHINAKSTEYSIVEKAKELLNDFGAPETWYYDVPAFVLLGERSCLSISGKDYSPATEKVGKINLVTVDLSPLVGNVWGDCARSYFVENGICINKPGSKDFVEGRFVEKELHKQMLSFVTPEVKFSELYKFGNDQICEMGYENLDFLGNLGHSIETEAHKRRFIDKNCSEKLSSTKLFTFEPHIRKVGSSWGFKYENIYYFNNEGRAVEL